MKRLILLLQSTIIIFGFSGVPASAELSIYEIQYTTDPNGASSYHGAVIDCMGGIVIHKWTGGRPRLTLYDPNYPDGWGGIMAKDLDSVGVFADVNVGDWVSFTNVEVEDYRGTTFLQYKSEHEPNCTIVSRDHVLPEPLVVSVDEIAAPIEDVNEWVVVDHNAEQYECMLLKVIDVNVKDRGYGKGPDNYILESNTDPNHTCWASDYMNEDNTAIYHDYVQIGQKFCGVTGILEQYEGEKYDIYYDYYQLLTRATEDFTKEQYCDLNYDCGVDFSDFAFFAGRWLTEEQCTDPNWCGGADLSQDGYVDMTDLREFSLHWLEGTYRK